MVLAHFDHTLAKKIYKWKGLFQACLLYTETLRDPGMRGLSPDLGGP